MTDNSEQQTSTTTSKPKEAFRLCLANHSLVLGHPLLCTRRCMARRPLLPGTLSERAQSKIENKILKSWTYRCNSVLGHRLARTVSRNHAQKH